MTPEEIQFAQTRQINAQQLPNENKISAARIWQKALMPCLNTFQFLNSCSMYSKFYFSNVDTCGMSIIVQSNILYCIPMIIEKIHKTEVRCEFKLSIRADPFKNMNNFRYILEFLTQTVYVIYYA